MNKSYFCLFLVFIITSCDTLGTPSIAIPIQSPFPTSTPNIISPTPLIIQPSLLTITPNITTIVQITPTQTTLPPPTPTITPVLPTQTFTQPIIQSVAVEILGCNTSLDILNGMGEVTNAFVTVKNTGTVDLPNTCALLRAIDEGREHPDKTVCVDNLPLQNQVTLKLTVDSTYQADTIIQVDVTTNDVILLRVDRQSCRDISLFGGAPADVGVIKPAK
ncbi:MAG: hypothetical protein JNK32_06830 [Anaerolineales bacterium]|nr:hypothetical protein [Anaerolineales bacterium]